ncbi:hypothetical protein [Photorhabdus heterorhabditis]|uniref:hypothetical protein n=1 Tax=Photorhabdus heterorhabditis TaxID=880156 RepID=UPI000ABB1487|nr:hypothetical protein [Photorhabdus heterorhabditis]
MYERVHINNDGRNVNDTCRDTRRCHRVASPSTQGWRAFDDKTLPLCLEGE